MLGAVKEELSCQSNVQTKNEWGLPTGSETSRRSAKASRCFETVVEGFGGDAESRMQECAGDQLESYYLTEEITPA